MTPRPLGEGFLYCRQQLVMDRFRQAVSKPDYLFVGGWALVALGVLLAVGQIWRNGGFSGTGGFLTALQLHVGLMAFGGAAVAIYYAVGAYQLQKQELKNAEEQLGIAKEQIKELQQVPNVVIGWAESEGVRVEGPLAMVTATPANVPPHLELEFLLSNSGRRLASIYEIAMQLPADVTKIVEQHQPNGDRYFPKPIRTDRANNRPNQNAVTYSWVVAQDREFVLVPNGNPIRVTLLRIYRHPQGPLQSASTNPAIWGVEHNLLVTINGDWGSQPPQTLRLKLKLVNISS